MKTKKTSSQTVFNKLQQPKKVGIVAYGAYVPSARILSEEIDVNQGKEPGSTAVAAGLLSKSVPALDEDTITLAIMAAGQALSRTSLDPATVGSLFIGSESHPYAVKPSGVTVATALGLSENIAIADLEFACKAGTQGLQIVSAFVQSGMHTHGIAIGADTAQAAPGDALEYSAAAGSAAYILGSKNILAELIATTSVATDTPDFWRANGSAYPSHAGRFTGEPAYFAHITKSVTALLHDLAMQPADIDYCVFHTPNLKFPSTIAKRLGFTPAQLKPSLLVQSVGNTYSASSLLALAQTLDTVGANKTILVASYGSGAGSDAFLFKTTPLLVQQRKKWEGLLSDQLAQTYNVSYSEYLHRTARGHS